MTSTRRARLPFIRRLYLRTPGTPIAASSATSPESCWQTPQKLLARIRAGVPQFRNGIDLDPCTSEANPVGAKLFFTVHTNGLIQPWACQADSIFVNPPFIDAAEWASKSYMESQTPERPALIFLGPAAIGTTWLHDLWERADDGLFLRKRIRYEGVCVFKLGEKPNRKSCCLGPEAEVHDKTHPEHHKYTEGSPTRGTALFAFNCSLEGIADLGTRVLGAVKGQRDGLRIGLDDYAMHC